MANPPQDQVSNEELLSMSRCFELFVRRIAQHRTILELNTEVFEPSNYVNLEHGCMGFMIKHMYSELYVGIVMGQGRDQSGFVHKWSVFKASKDGDMTTECLSNNPKFYYTRTLFEAEEIVLLGMWESLGSYSQIDEFHLYGHWCLLGDCYYCMGTNALPRGT